MSWLYDLCQLAYINQVSIKKFAATKSPLIITSSPAPEQSNTYGIGLHGAVRGRIKEIK